MPIDWLLGSVGLTIVWANVCIEVIDSPPSFLSAMVIIVAEVLFDLTVADGIPSGKLSLRKVTWRSMVVRGGEKISAWFGVKLCTHRGIFDTKSYLLLCGLSREQEWG